MPLAGKNVFDFLISAITTRIHYDSAFVFMFVFSEDKPAVERVWPNGFPRKHLICNHFPVQNKKKFNRKRYYFERDRKLHEC